MHITITPDISYHNRLIQQLPSGSGSRPLQFSCHYLSYYQNTADPLQVPFLLGHHPAPLLPHATTISIFRLIPRTTSFIPSQPPPLMCRQPLSPI